MSNDIMKIRILAKEQAQNCEAWNLPDILSKQDSGNIQTPKQLAQEQEVLQEQLNSIKQQASQEGFSKGKEEGILSAEQEIEKKLKRLDELVVSFKHSIQGLEQVFEQQVIDLSIAIAKAIVRSQITTNQEVIVNVVKEALACLPKSVQDIEVLLNADDLAMLNEYINAKGLLAEFKDISCKEDASISRGGCMVNSNISHVDATLEKRLADVLNNVKESVQTVAQTSNPEDNS